jgi:4-diphosphocytidyl-2-C-methyl-D-erythritol kinase
LILPSSQHLSTADVYREADRMGLPRPVAELEEGLAALTAALRPGGELPPEHAINDLEPAARSLCPTIDVALADARAAGALAAGVSGSGPTVFGLFPSEDDAREAAGELVSRHPGARAAAPVRPGLADVFGSL